MEYLDYYDENGKYLGFKSREEIHEKGLWHNTVHNWLYTKDGKAIFQIRKDSNKFYTTASGHVSKGETIKDALIRETKEELGIDIKKQKTTLIGINTWIMDKVKSDGTVNKDRAKAHIHITEYDLSRYEDFKFDEDEVKGIVCVDAKEALELFESLRISIPAILVTCKNGKNEREECEVTSNDFLTLKDETPLGKYGEILKTIAEKTSQKNFKKEIFLSFKPEYYKPLLYGLKKYEYRRRFCDEETEAFLYLSGKERKVVGILSLGRPLNLIETREKCLEHKNTLKRVDSYIEEGIVNAIPIKSLTLFEKPVTLEKIRSHIPGFMPPQLYYTLENQPALKKILDNRALRKSEFIHDHSSIYYDNLALSVSEIEKTEEYKRIEKDSQHD